MNETIQRLAKDAYGNKTLDYSLGFLWDFLAVAFGFVIALGFSENPREFSTLSITIFVPIVVLVVIHIVYRTYSFFLCRKNYKANNYTYHHVEIDDIRAGHRGTSLFADFTYNGKTYSELVEDYKYKYIHVFDCSGIIMSVIDSENLLK